jgi:uncharacterized protein with NRDE domain
MCTLILLARPGHDWPLLLAANRDEMADRPSRPPGRHWEDREQVVGGLDLLAGGSWLGLNDQGVVAGLLNRRNSLGPDAAKRSRGELVLEALDHADAAAAAAAMRDLSPEAYRPFNLIIADDRDRFWIRNDGATIQVRALPDGLTMIAADEVNDDSNPRLRRHRPTFLTQIPEPSVGDWTGWKQALASRPNEDPRDGLCFGGEVGFGTRSSSLIALPPAGIAERRPLFFYADGPPDKTDWSAVSL